MDPSTMSIQQVNPYQQQRAGSQPQEDCRDYLRTGRCKYGASCKYNHPSNVQTGGGLKGPIDPTEPMFPVRPNEPVCQYYMKHGTCKFGQACKFHHPPQSAMTATLVTGGTVVMNVGRGGDQGHQVLLNAVATDAGGSSMMLQFLPQRPDEPDCIYFLRNGRCKYGATCRYHHPVNYARKSRDDGGGVRRSPLKGPVESTASPQFQFVMASPSYPPSPFQQSQNATGSHVVLADGPVTFVTLDGSSVAEHSFRSLAMQQNSDLAATHGAPSGASFGLGMQQEQNSSSSSMSSSYETAGSSMGDSGSALWNARRSGSGNSLNAYVLESSSHGHNHMSGAVGNDVSLSRRNRASSPGSDASGVYFDSVTSMSWSSGPAGPPAGAYGPGPSWRSRRSSSFDQTRQVPQNPYATRDMMPRSTSVPEALGEHDQIGQSPLPPRRPPVHATRQHRGYPTSDNTDEGLSMMTSALLNMIDTPEDSTNGFGVYEDDVTEGSLPEPTTPRSGSSFRAYSNYAKHHSAPQLPPDENMRASNLPSGSYSSGYNGHNDDPRYAQSNFSVRQRMPNLPYREQQPNHSGKADDFTWLPSWQGSLTVGRQMEEKAQSLSAIQPSIGPNPTPGTANVGLFLS